ncbi:MAG: hypothetical protein OEY21_02205 [Nitrospira sp.]|nr:hypothetical protein [Nitrospira sp.]MDH5251985.1 hypothetical protein [Nitrospira sp.]MDH5624895.1 hypothetical protein [Nitrospira sp.]
MTITCPACSHENSILPESPSLDWQAAACAACEANFLLVKAPASHGRQASRSTAAKAVSRVRPPQNTSWWSRLRLRMLGAALLAAGIDWQVTGGIVS